MDKEYIEIRLDNETILILLTDSKYVKAMHPQDALLYVSLLSNYNLNWRLPTTNEWHAIYHRFHKKPSLQLAIVKNIDKPPSVKYDYDGKMKEGTVIPVSTIYKPTTFKRILTWLKNTTVANIVRKS